VALGFWDILGAFSVVGEFARVGGAKVLELEDQNKVPPSSFPRRSQNPCLTRGPSRALPCRLELTLQLFWNVQNVDAQNERHQPFKIALPYWSMMF
jgi:hypothetical protein